MTPLTMCLFFFFFNDTATTEIYTLSLHDALPISAKGESMPPVPLARFRNRTLGTEEPRSELDRKSTRLNSSHTVLSYAVFCFNKKKEKKPPQSKIGRGHAPNPFTQEYRMPTYAYK